MAINTSFLNPQSKSPTQSIQTGVWRGNNYPQSFNISHSGKSSKSETYTIKGEKYDQVFINKEEYLNALEKQKAEKLYSSPQTSINIASQKASFGSGLNSIGVRGGIINKFQGQEEKASFVGGVTAGNIESRKQNEIINKNIASGKYKNEPYISLGTKDKQGRELYTTQGLINDTNFANTRINEASSRGSQESLSTLNAQRDKTRYTRMYQEESNKIIGNYEGSFKGGLFSKNPKGLQQSEKAQSFYLEQAKKSGGKVLPLTDPVTMLVTPQFLPVSGLVTLARAKKNDIKATSYNALASGTKWSYYGSRPDVLIRNRPVDFALGASLAVAPEFSFGAKAVRFTEPVLLSSIPASIAFSKPENQFSTVVDLGGTSYGAGLGYGASKSIVRGSRYLFNPRVKYSQIGSQIFEEPLPSRTNQYLFSPRQKTTLIYTEGGNGKPTAFIELKPPRLSRQNLPDFPKMTGRKASLSGELKFGSGRSRSQFSQLEGEFQPEPSIFPESKSFISYKNPSSKTTFKPYSGILNINKNTQSNYTPYKSEFQIPSSKLNMDIFSIAKQKTENFIPPPNPVPPQPIYILLTKQKTEINLIKETFSGSITDSYTYNETPSIPRAGRIGLTFPSGGTGSGYNFKPRIRSKRGYKYNPTIFSSVFKIKGKESTFSTKTGLSVRPI